MAESGEDTIISCSHCDYAANVEKAELGQATKEAFDDGPLEEAATPSVRTIEEVSAFLDQPAERFIKTLLYIADDQVVMVLVRGNEHLSEAKLRATLGCTDLRMADDDEILRHTGAPQGFAGPVGVGLRTVADHDLLGCRGMVTGANKADTHLRNVAQDRDFAEVEFADLRVAVGGEPCPRCAEGAYEPHRGIEVGHVFYLGKKYSEALGATYLDTDGEQQTMEMGTYGIGVTRTVAAAIEQNHDENGIVWPVAIAPYEVVIVPVRWNDEETRKAAEDIYAALLAEGIEVVLDDRDERAGVKFNDADLVGFPYRVTIGPRALKAGNVELKRRASSDSEEFPLADAAAEVAARIRTEKAEAAA